VWCACMRAFLFEFLIGELFLQLFEQFFTACVLIRVNPRDAGPGPIAVPCCNHVV
jgi:hypothetical protein